MVKLSHMGFKAKIKHCNFEPSLFNTAQNTQLYVARPELNVYAK